MNIKRHLFSLATALLALATVPNTYAAESSSFTTIISDDITTVFTAPGSWEAEDWKKLGWASLAVIGTAVVADRPVRDYMCQQSMMNSCPGAGNNAEVTNSALTTIEHFGKTYAVGIMGGFYLAGIVTDNAKSVQVAQDLVAASVTSVLVNQSIKVTLNRSRPRENLGNNNFVGYTGPNNNSSFPSGHTTEAFTLASVIASHYDQTWVSVVSYSTASLVGIARMYHDAHFASDVVASAFIGTYIGKAVVKHNSSLRGNNIALLPMLGPDLTGMQLVGNF